MKKLLLLILVSLVAQTTQAQKWAPLGMTWKYVFDDYTWGGPSLHRIDEWVASDTMMIGGHLCTIIHPTSKTIDTNKMLSTMITYEDSNKVYWYSPASQKFIVLYDFNKNVGESWFISGLPRNDFTSKYDTNSCVIEMKVDSIKTEIVNSISLKCLYVSGGFGGMGRSFEGKIIEGIGHVTRPRPWVNCALSCNIITDCWYDYFGLRCIDNGTIGFYDFKIAPDCDYLGIKDVQKSSGMKITPNPSNGTFTITTALQLNGQTIKVFDLLGKVIYEGKLKDKERTIQLNASSGMYIVEVQSLEGTVWRERVVVE